MPEGKMEDEPTFEQIREDVEERQKNILWEEARRGGTSVDAFLWKGDPHAKPIQRAGLIVFGLMFLLFAITIASIPFQKDFEDGWPIEFFMAFLALLIALRLFRNAFRRDRSQISASHPDE
jgi:hypothetical protein